MTPKTWWRSQVEADISRQDCFVRVPRQTTKCSSYLKKKKQKTKTSESCVQSEPFHDHKLDTGVGLGLVKFGAGSLASVSCITR